MQVVRKALAAKKIPLLAKTLPLLRCLAFGQLPVLKVARPGNVVIGARQGLASQASTGLL